jgi:hypothetical protein
LPLSNKLNEAISTANSRLCKLGALLAGTELSEEDKKMIKQILSVSEQNPARVPNTTLAKILREEGYDIGNSVVDRHKRGDCPCKRIGR